MIVPFLLFLIALPLIEIAVLVMVGSNIGVLATLGLVIATGFLGTVLLRLQGMNAFSRLQGELRLGRPPEKEIANAAMIMLAGIFLIIPGFVSDIIGILLFLPPVRSFVIKTIASRVTIVQPGFRRQEADVVDLDESQFRRTDAPGESSPWKLPPQ